MKPMIYLLITYQKFLTNVPVKEGSPPKLKDYSKFNSEKISYISLNSVASPKKWEFVICIYICKDYYI